MDASLRSTLEEVAAAEEQIMNATIRRYEAWRRLLSNLASAPEQQQRRTRARKRPPANADASASEPKVKKPRVVPEDDAVRKKHLTPRVWVQHYGSVSKWKRDGGDTPLVLDTPPSSTTKKVYDMTIDQVHALTALEVASLIIRVGCRLSRFGVVDLDNTSLRSLRIERNDSFSGFDVSIVGGLQALEVLEVVDCRSFVKLPEDIGRMTSLRVLRIHANFAERGVLPKSIFDLHQLEVLDIANFKVLFPDWGTAVIPRKIEAMVHLKELRLEHCNIINLWPNSFMKLVGLEKLFVFTCDLNGLPEGIGKMTGLKYMKFSHADIKALPDEIGQLQNLRSIDLLSNYELDATTILPVTRTCRMLESVKYDRRDVKKGDPFPSHVTAAVVARRNYHAAFDVLKCLLHVDTLVFPLEIMVRIAAIIYDLSDDEVETVVCRAKEKTKNLVVIE